MKNLINQFIKNEDGVTAIEYAVIGVAMAALLGGIFAKNGTLSNSMKDAFGKIATQLGSNSI